MSLDSFFHPDLKVTDSRILLSHSESHHARKVLRKKDGQEVCLFNGAGVKAEGYLRFHGNSGCGVEIQTVQSTDRPDIRPILALAVPENKDTFHEIIRASVQLGVAEIVLLSTRYCGLRRSGNVEKILEKCRRIIVNSCKQSGQLWMPEISGPFGMISFFDRVPSDVHVFAGLEPERESGLSYPDNHSLSSGSFYWMVGPEGGWSDVEMDLLSQNKVCKIMFGSLTMTTKTAAIAGLAALLTRFQCW